MKIFKSVFFHMEHVGCLAVLQYRRAVKGEQPLKLAFVCTHDLQRSELFLDGRNVFRCAGVLHLIQTFDIKLFRDLVTGQTVGFSIAGISRDDDPLQEHGVSS